MKIKQKIRRIAASLLTLATILTAINFTALPVNADWTSDASGGGSQGVQTGDPFFSWYTNNQGYRICIVDAKTGAPKSNAVDFLFATPPAGITDYLDKKSRTGGTVSKTVQWSQLSLDPPKPLVGTANQIAGNGAELTTWMLDEADDYAHLQAVLNAKPGGNYVFTFASAEDRTKVGNGSKISEVVVEQEYKLTVEPITWYIPAISGQDAYGYATTRWDGWIYGTLSELCAWQSKYQANLGGRGGNNGPVLRAMYTSLVNESNVFNLSAISTQSAQSAMDSKPTVDQIISYLGSNAAALQVYTPSDSLKVNTEVKFDTVVWYIEEYEETDASGKTTTKQRYASQVLKDKTINEISTLKDSEERVYNGSTYLRAGLVKLQSGKFTTRFDEENKSEDENKLIIRKGESTSNPGSKDPSSYLSALTDTYNTNSIDLLEKYDPDKVKLAEDYYTFYMVFIKPAEEPPVIDPTFEPPMLPSTLTVLPDEQEVEGEAGYASKLSPNVTARLDFELSDDAIEAWSVILLGDAENKIKGIDKVTVKISLFDKVTLTDENGTESVKQAVREKFTYTAGATTALKTKLKSPTKEGITFDCTGKELAALLKKGYITWKDTVTDLELKAAQAMLFECKLKMSVEFAVPDCYENYKDYGNGITINITDAANKSLTTLTDSADYFRNADPALPEYMKYSSDTLAYSELKQGTVDNEEFEAMAGVPTTRNLYFGVGGSEFAVDYEATLQKQNEAYRKYKIIFGSTDCEFKVDDQAKEVKFPAPTGGGSGTYTVSSAHEGGKCSVTWTGTTSWEGDGGVDNVWDAWVDNRWDDSDYEKAMETANAYATKINAYTYKYTAASDGKERTQTGWGAGVSGKNTHIEGTAIDGNPPEDIVVNGEVVGQKPATPGSYTSGQPNTWTVTVEWEVPEHTCCGPCCEHELPAITDTWSQKITYDYVDINKLGVWRLTSGKLTGMASITGNASTNIIDAFTIQGQPDVFYNIAQEETAEAGRFRFTFTNGQTISVDGINVNIKDTGNGQICSQEVVVKVGSRTDKCDKQTDSDINGEGMLKYQNTSYPNERERLGEDYSGEDYLDANTTEQDKQTSEYKLFRAFRDAKVEARVVSDLCILQTTQGDYSVMYYIQKSDAVQTTHDFTFNGKDYDEQHLSDVWTGNSNSAYSWTKTKTIPISSYTGKYYSTPKYSAYNSSKRVDTIFRTDGYKGKINIPARPSEALRVYKDNIDILDTLPNGSYNTGTASAFWEAIVTEKDVDCKSPYSHSVKLNSLFGMRGFSKNAPYSASHSKINDIVIHDPVSAEYAMILPIDTGRDQRAENIDSLAEELNKQPIKCPGIGSLCEYAALSCNYNGPHEHIASCYLPKTPETLNAHQHNTDCLDTAKLNQAFQRKTTVDTEQETSTQTTITVEEGTKTLSRISITSGSDNVRPIGRYSIVTYDSNMGPNVREIGSYSIKGMPAKAFNVYIYQISIPRNSTDGISFNIDDRIVEEEEYLCATVYTTGNQDDVRLQYMYDNRVVAEVKVGEAEIGTTSYGYNNYRLYTFDMSAAAGKKINAFRFVCENTGSSGKSLYVQYISRYTVTTEKNITTNETQVTSDPPIASYFMQQALTVTTAEQTITDKSDTITINTNYTPAANDYLMLKIAGNTNVTGLDITAAANGSAINPPSSVDIKGTNTVCFQIPTSWQGKTITQLKLEFRRPTDADGTIKLSSASFVHDGADNPFYGEKEWDLTNMSSVYKNGQILITGAWMMSQTPTALSHITNCTGTTLNVHECGNNCQHEDLLDCADPHHEGGHADTCYIACNDDSKHSKKSSTIGTATGTEVGDFINLDWGFQISFPTTGDFLQNPDKGVGYCIGQVTANRGLGYINNMETKEWVAAKYVKFDFDVIYCGAAAIRMANGSQHGTTADGSSAHKHTDDCKVYYAGEWIELNKDYDLFNFYCVGSNQELAGSPAKFKVIAINSPIEDTTNNQPTNKYRPASTFAAQHGAIKTTYIDVIGRIGGMVMEDTGDFRFSNLFKQEDPNAEGYFAAGLISKVDLAKKNYVLASLNDVRGLPRTKTSYGLDTYGNLTWLRSDVLQFPLTHDKNNIPALRSEPLRFGYLLYMDIQTLGKDYTTIDIMPSYYWLNFETGAVEPVDVYMLSDRKYQLINKFGNAYSDNPVEVYPYFYYLDWLEEADRRNIQTNEKTLTGTISSFVPTTERYNLGTADRLRFGELARTFIGNSKTLGIEQNIDARISSYAFQRSVKRWHFTLGLPSSAVVVASNSIPSQENIDKYTSDKGVVLLTADLFASSDLYTLQYPLENSHNGKQSITIDENTYTLPANLSPIISVYGGNDISSVDDLQIRKTH